MKPDTVLSKAKLSVIVRETEGGFDVRVVSTEGQTRACGLVTALADAVSNGIKAFFDGEVYGIN